MTDVLSWKQILLLYFTMVPIFVLVIISFAYSPATLGQRLLTVSLAFLWPLILMAMVGVIVLEGLYWVATGKRLTE